MPFIVPEQGNGSLPNPAQPNRNTDPSGQPNTRQPTVWPSPTGQPSGVNSRMRDPHPYQQYGRGRGTTSHPSQQGLMQYHRRQDQGRRDYGFDRSQYMSQPYMEQGRHQRPSPNPVGRGAAMSSHVYYPTPSPNPVGLGAALVASNRPPDSGVYSQPGFSQPYPTPPVMGWDEIIPQPFLEEDPESNYNSRRREMYGRY